MRLRKLKSGSQISPEIQLDSLLDTHNGISLYLASDEAYGHALVHILPDFEGESLEQLEKAVEFYKNVLNLQARCGRYEEFLFFSEPFPLGEFMFEWLERRGRIALPEALKRIISLLKVLEQAHKKNIMHGRITPKLVLMERSASGFGLRLMGLGVAGAMTDSLKNDIDWFDYTFDLEGMSSVAVDIYGMAIILMGLVSGESGIDSFEATGLLPQMFRGGMLQQAMEKALALRIDAYTDILSFSLDLEAALLELDERQGEVFVGDLVGFESAVRSVVSGSDDSGMGESSGVWNALLDTLEQEERSSLLCSLTSLTAIKTDDEDEDVTRVTSMPTSVLGMRRIHSVHAEKAITADKIEADKKEADKKDGESAESANSSDLEITEVLTSSNIASILDPAKKSDDEAEEKAETASMPAETEQKLADLKQLEDELEDDEDEEDAPTRIMMRPNYSSISFGQENQGVNSSIASVLQDDDGDQKTLAGMKKRISAACVVSRDLEIQKDVIYDPNDPIAFPPEDEIIPQAADENGESSELLNATDRQNAQEECSESHMTRKSSFTLIQRCILVGLAGLVFILALVAIVTLVQRSEQEPVQPHFDVPEAVDAEKNTDIEKNSDAAKAPEDEKAAKDVETDVIE